MQQQRLACHFELTSFKAQGGAALPKHFLEHGCMCVYVSVSVRARARDCVCVYARVRTWPLDPHLAAGSEPTRADSSTRVPRRSKSQHRSRQKQSARQTGCARTSLHRGPA